MVGYLHHLRRALLVQDHLSANAADECSEACLDCSETSNASEQRVQTLQVSYTVLLRDREGEVSSTIYM